MQYILNRLKTLTCNEQKTITIRFFKIIISDPLYCHCPQFPVDICAELVEPLLKHYWHYFISLLDCLNEMKTSPLKLVGRDLGFSAFLADLQLLPEIGLQIGGSGLWVLEFACCSWSHY